jgi:hypothetical protein
MSNTSSPSSNVIPFITSTSYSGIDRRQGGGGNGGDFERRLAALEAQVAPMGAALQKISADVAAIPDTRNFLTIFQFLGYGGAALLAMATLYAWATPELIGNRVRELIENSPRVAAISESTDAADKKLDRVIDELNSMRLELERNKRSLSAPDSAEVPAPASLKP